MAAIEASGGFSGGLPTTDPFTIASVAVDVYRAPITRPVRTAFGTMTDRPAVVVEARSTDGFSGYGEVWCNFPSPAAGYRARLIESVLGPEISGRTWTGPGEAFDHLSESTRVLALQAGEPGPFSQAIAGIDIALWDLAARRAGQPLWRLLGGEGNRRVPAYASGIGPDGAAAQARRARSSRPSGVQAEGRLRPGGRPRQPRADAPGTRPGHAHRGGRQPGLVPGAGSREDP